METKSLKQLAVDTLKKCGLNNRDGLELLENRTYDEVYFLISDYIDEDNESLMDRTEAVVYYYG
jgi:hypothetical protein